MEIVEPESLVTPEGREEWETYKQYKSAVSSLFRSQEYGTAESVDMCDIKKGKDEKWGRKPLKKKWIIDVFL